MMHVSEQELATIIAILEKHLPQGEARVFGSRHRGNHKPYSDLDVAVKLDDKMSISALGALREEFAASNLLFRVDVVDYWGISPEFRQAIDKEFYTIYMGSSSCK